MWKKSGILLLVTITMTACSETIFFGGKSNKANTRSAASEAEAQKKAVREKILNAPIDVLYLNVSQALSDSPIKIHGFVFEGVKTLLEERQPQIDELAAHYPTLASYYEEAGIDVNQPAPKLDEKTIFENAHDVLMGGKSSSKDTPAYQESNDAFQVETDSSLSLLNDAEKACNTGQTDTPATPINEYTECAKEIGEALTEALFTGSLANASSYAAPAAGCVYIMGSAMHDITNRIEADRECAATTQQVTVDSFGQAPKQAGNISCRLPNNELESLPSLSCTSKGGVPNNK